MAVLVIPGLLILGSDNLTNALQEVPGSLMTTGTLSDEVHFAPVAITPYFISLWGSFTIHGIDAEAGDEVGVFVDDNCFGAFKVTNPGWYGALAVYGDDPMTPEKDGAEPGDFLTLKAWDSSSEIEITISSVDYTGPEPLIWTGDGDVLQVDITVLECTENSHCDDGWYCNGVEICTDNGSCRAGSSPCTAGTECREELDECLERPLPDSSTTSTVHSSNGGGNDSSPTTTTSTASTVPQTTTTTASEDNESDTSTTSAVENPSPDETTTTTTIKASKCIFNKIFIGNDRFKIEAYRNFRDKRLAKSLTGLLLINLYYIHSQEVTAILSSNPEVLLFAKEFAGEMVPIVELNISSDDRILLTKEQYLKILHLMHLLKVISSPALNKSISFILERLESGKLLDKLNIEIHEHYL